MGNILNVGGGDDMHAKYILKNLPISGPDYKIQVDRKGSTEDFLIEKKGDTIVIDHFDNSKDIVIKNDLKDVGGKKNGSITIDRPGTMEDEIITQSGDRIFINRPGIENDVEIKKTGDEIVINRSNTSKYTKYRKGEESWEIDRDGFRNDVHIYRDPADKNTIKIDKYGDADDVSVNRTDDKGLDVRAWYQDLTMTPEGFELVTGWLDQGLNAEDLVRLTEDGKLHIMDDYLY